MNESQAIQSAVDRYVLTETGGAYNGSGVVIASGLILTCFHSLRADCAIKVNGKKAKVVDFDTENDLALVSAPTKRFSTLELGSVSLAEQVFFVGNPSSLSGVLLFGRVSHIKRDQIAHDAHGTFGVSGSGLFNLKGQLVGINKAVLGSTEGGNWLTTATPSSHLKKFLSHIK